MKLKYGVLMRDTNGYFLAEIIEEAAEKVESILNTRTRAENFFIFGEALPGDKKIGVVQIKLLDK